MTKEHSPVREQQGPIGDVIPTNDGRDARTGGGQKPEPVEQRPAVGTVKPEDYPIDERQAGIEPPDGE